MPCPGDAMGTDPGSTRLSVAVEDRVRAAQRGDVAAMDALLTELAPWVGRICAAIALDRGPDAMQETLVLVLRNLPTLREPAALRAWVRRIAVRQSLRMVPDGRVVLVPGLSDSADRPAGLRGGGAGGPAGAPRPAGHGGPVRARDRRAARCARGDREVGPAPGPPPVPGPVGGIVTVHIVGGGIAGLVAAITAAEEGAP